MRFIIKFTHYSQMILFFESIVSKIFKEIDEDIKKNRTFADILFEHYLLAF